MTCALATVRLDEILRVGRMRNASDVHLRAGSAPVLRIDGALQPQQTLLTGEEELQALIESVLDSGAQMQLAETGDASVARRFEGVGAVRVHAYRTASGPCLAIRFLASTIPTCDSLGLPAAVAEFAEKPHGLVIFSGPTGSGKSTALAALIDRINRTQTRHVITIEDPIEYEHLPDRSLIDQRELGRDVTSFDEAVRGALRSDPDVILVGEMRDAQTMQAALTAAETGHLVFSTLHTGDVPQTIDRVLAALDGSREEHARSRAAQAIAGVVCLRLVPRASGAGRRCAAEVLVANDAVRSIIRGGRTHQLRNVLATSRHAGMQTLEADLSRLVAGKEISPSAARLATDRPDEVRVDAGAAA